MDMNQTRVGDGCQPDSGGRWVSTRLSWEMGVNQTRVGDGCQPDMGGKWVSIRLGWEMGVNQTVLGVKMGVNYGWDVDVSSRY